MSQVIMTTSNMFRPPDYFVYDSLQSMVTNWKTWYKQFCTYLIATEYDKKSDEVKVNSFLNLVGPQGVELYESFTWDVENDNLKLNKVIEKFQAHMNQNKNITVCRFAFLNCDQKEGQTLDDYIKEVTLLRKDCEFESDTNIHDTLLRDKIISGLQDRGLQEKLLRLEPGKCTLQTVMATCRLHEISKDQSALLDSSDTSINAIQKPSTASYRRPMGSRDGSSSKQPFPSRQNQRPCKKCGRNHKFGQCGAHGKQCYYCEEYNHFEKLCPKKRNRISQIESQAEQENEYPIDNVNQIKNDVSRVQTFYLSAIDDTKNQKSKWVVDLKVNDQLQSRFKIDSGADVSILSSVDYQNLKNRPPLSNANAILKAYNRTRIPVLGKCELKVQYGDKDPQILPFIVAKFESVISGKHSEDLNLIKRLYSVESSIDPSIFEGVGCLKDEIKLHINDEVTPVVHPPRKVPHTVLPKLKKELDRMESLDVIFPIQEPTDWVSSLVIAEKSNGDMRLCLDPKHLNKAIKRQHYPIRTAEEIFGRMKNPRIFSKLDCTSGYWQIKVDEKSSKLLCFNTPFGRYCFKRLPFGVHIASEIFQQKIEELFSGMDGVANAQDDIIVWGSTQEEHDLKLKEVIQIISEAGLKLNKDKCEFGVSSLLYLGHIISKEGIIADPSKIKAITEMPIPADKKGVQRLLGMVNYVGKFIPNLSTMTDPLRKLIEKDSEFKITKDHVDAMKKIKKVLTEPQILKLFDGSRETKLACDSSSFGLGAVLLQRYDKDWLPVAYASRSLTKTEQRYAQIEKECLSVVFGVSKFHEYVYGKPFVVDNDHKPLQTIFKKDINQMPPRIQRMMLALVKYPSMDVRYVPGSKLHIPDTLSRAPMKNSDSEFEAEIECHIHAVYTNLPATDEIKLKFADETSQDEILKKVMKFVVNEWPEKSSECPNEVRTYWNFRDEITTNNGILYKGSQIIVPSSMRQYVKKQIHTGHLGIVKCKSRAKTYFYWPSMNNEIEHLVNTCGTCQQYRNAQPRETNIPVVDYEPWNSVGADVFHYRDHHYLISVDYYSSYPVVQFLNRGRAHGTSKLVISKMKETFSHHGIPEKLISDGGPQFTSMEFKDFCKQWNIQHCLSSPEYPRGNGRAERAVQTCKNLIKKAIDSHSDIEAALLAYRTTKLQDCNASPAELLFNRVPRNHLNAHLDVENRKEETRTVPKRNPMYTQKHANEHTRDLSTLEVGDNVRMRQNNAWPVKGTVSYKHPNPRSYVLTTTDGRQFRRNRQHLLKTGEKWNKRVYTEVLDDDFVYVSDSEDIDMNVTQEPLNSDSGDDSDNGFDAGDYRRFSTRSNMGVPPERY